MHGIGNDFVMVNAFQDSRSDDAYADLARAMCDRRFGIGADGLILAAPGDSATLRMRMWNPDGSESEMCGNGVRCFAHFALAEGLATGPEIPVETGAGLLRLRLQPDGLVQVDMGVARLSTHEIGMNLAAAEGWVGQPISACGQEWLGTAVSMGNPHLVINLGSVAEIPLETWGPELERHPLFPRRVNVHFVQVNGPDEITMRTWERGAGITLACGTGACACAVASHLRGFTGREVLVHLPGGELHIRYAEDGHVFMTGPAAFVFTGEWHDSGRA